MITFKKYEQKAFVPAANYPNKGHNIIYPTLGLVGEAGEVSEKIKKLWRDKGIVDGMRVPAEEAAEIVKELGDVLWYVTAIACELGVNLELVAKWNIDKLEDRRARGTMAGSGDNR